MGKTKESILRPPAEVQYAQELAALAKADRDPRPAGWTLSPRAVRSFICGCEKPLIERKFFGDGALVERAIITLAGNRGLLLVGDGGQVVTHGGGSAKERPATVSRAGLEWIG